MDVLLNRLNDLERQIKSLRIARKKVLTFHEACSYCGFTTSHMYKLTAANTIPHYKPNGKMIFFRRAELDRWLVQNRNVTRQEVQELINYFQAQKGRKSS